MHLILNMFQERDKNTNICTNNSADEEINDEEKENAIGSSIFRKLQRPSVEDILKTTTQGRAILKFYRQTKLLSRKCRNLLVGLILSDILNRINGLFHKYLTYKAVFIIQSGT